MPARNMGGDPTAANPSTGKPVIMNPFSGPKGSLLDNDQPGNSSTGAAVTGIGFGPNLVISAPAVPNVKNAGFNVPYTPGKTKPGGSTVSDASMLAIGGGSSARANNGAAPTTPLTVSGGDAGILAFGNGAERDGSLDGTGHATTNATATDAVSNGSNIVSGVANRTGAAMKEGQTANGVQTSDSGKWVKHDVGVIDATPTPDDDGGTVTVEGVTEEFVDGAVLNIEVIGSISVSGTATVSSDAFDSGAISLDTMDGGEITVKVSGVDRFGNTVVDTSSFTYAPA